MSKVKIGSSRWAMRARLKNAKPRKNVKVLEKRIAALEAELESARQDLKILAERGSQQLEAKDREIFEARRGELQARQEVAAWKATLEQTVRKDSVALVDTQLNKIAPEAMMAIRKEGGR